MHNCIGSHAPTFARTLFACNCCTQRRRNTQSQAKHHELGDLASFAAAAVASAHTHSICINISRACQRTRTQGKRTRLKVTHLHTRRHKCSGESIESAMRSDAKQHSRPTTNTHHSLLVSLSPTPTLESQSPISHHIFALARASLAAYSA